MKTLIGILAVCTLFVSSCKKEEVIEPIVSVPNPVPVLPPNYTPMTLGDYWVYETFRVDTLGNDSSMNELDSVYISTDTLIDGETFFVFRGTEYLFNPQVNSVIQIVRDSSGYLINHTGVTLFSATNFTDTLHSFYEMNDLDTIYFNTSKMYPLVVPVTVPDGTYNCLDYQTTYELFYTQPRKVKVFHHYYAEGKGLISSSFSFANPPWHYERRLIRSQVAIN